MKTGNHLWLGAIALVIIAVALQVLLAQVRPPRAQTRPADDGLHPSLKLPPPMFFPND